MNNIEYDINNIADSYNFLIKDVDRNANKESDRAYGGYLRSKKGKLQENITEEIVKSAWKSIGGEQKRLDINSKKIKVSITNDYLDKLPDGNLKEYINKNIKKYFYGISVDKHIFIDGKFVLGIECKNYTENAMLKRILVDFRLLKTLYPDIKCYLFQLESQLGGDYSELNDNCLGSPSTHTLLSYFPDVELDIITFVKGERKVDKPIHKYFKPIERKQIQTAIEKISKDLRYFL